MDGIKQFNKRIITKSLFTPHIRPFILAIFFILSNRDSTWFIIFHVIYFKEIWLYSSLHENKDELNRLSFSTDQSHTMYIHPPYFLQSIHLSSFHSTLAIHSFIHSTDRDKQVFAIFLNKYSSLMEDFKLSSNMFFWWRTNNEECMNTRIVILLELSTTTSTTTMMREVYLEFFIPWIVIHSLWIAICCSFW